MGRGPPSVAGRILPPGPFNLFLFSLFFSFLFSFEFRFENFYKTSDLIQASFLQIVNFLSVIKHTGEV
jgi:hypothetical protein